MLSCRRPHGPRAGAARTAGPSDFWPLPGGWAALAPAAGVPECRWCLATALRGNQCPLGTLKVVIELFLAKLKPGKVEAPS